MDEKFIMGVLLGMLGGALIVANSYKARQCVREKQDQVMNKVSELTEKQQKKSERQS